MVKSTETILKLLRYIGHLPEISRATLSKDAQQAKYSDQYSHQDPDLFGYWQAIIRFFKRVF